MVTNKQRIISNKNNPMKSEGSYTISYYINRTVTNKTLTSLRTAVIHCKFLLGDYHFNIVTILTLKINWLKSADL